MKCDGSERTVPKIRQRERQRLVHAATKVRKPPVNVTTGETCNTDVKF